MKFLDSPPPRKFLDPPPPVNISATR
jgi:hypothetical protein